MDVEKYLKDSTFGASIANYDKKIGTKGNSKTDYLEMVIKNDALISTIKQISNKNDLRVVINGNLVKIEGPTEKIRRIESQLKELGVK